MKLFPLIGALLISAAPIQAVETWEEIDKACEASHEALTVCIGVAGRFSAEVGFSILCRLRRDGAITAEVFNAEYGKINAYGPMFEGISKVSWNSGIEEVLEDYPNCPIKLLR